MCYRRISCISDDHLQYKLGTSTKCQGILEIGTFNAYFEVHNHIISVGVLSNIHVPWHRNLLAPHLLRLQVNTLHGDPVV